MTDSLLRALLAAGTELEDSIRADEKRLEESRRDLEQLRGVIRRRQFALGLPSTVVDAVPASAHETLESEVRTPVFVPAPQAPTLSAAALAILEKAERPLLRGELLARLPAYGIDDAKGNSVSAALTELKHKGKVARTDSGYWSLLKSSSGTKGDAGAPLPSSKIVSPPPESSWRTG